MSQTRVIVALNVLNQLLLPFVPSPSRQRCYIPRYEWKMFNLEARRPGFSFACVASHRLSYWGSRQDSATRHVMRALSNGSPAIISW